MKILFKDDKYVKVSDDLEADEKVKKFGWRYVKRSEWKKNVRDFDKKPFVKTDPALIQALSDKGKEAIAMVLSKQGKKTKSKNEQNRTK